MKVLTHNGKLTHFDFSKDERFFVSVGTDQQMKVFDMRNYYKEIESYYCPSNAIDLKISQTGLTALSLKNQVLFWKGLNQTRQTKPYLKHEIQKDKTINSIDFANFEDFLGISKTGGFESILVPGSGLANFDTFKDEVNYTKSQRKENEVKRLLDKLPLSSIMLHSDMIGKIDPTSKEIKD